MHPYAPAPLESFQPKWAVYRRYPYLYIMSLKFNDLNLYQPAIKKIKALRVREKLTIWRFGSIWKFGAGTCDNLAPKSQHLAERDREVVDPLVVLR